MRLIRSAGFSTFGEKTKLIANLSVRETVHLRANIARLSSKSSFPPVYDSRTGFNDYYNEKKKFQLKVPEFFNFSNILDDWAQKEKVGS